MPDPDADAWAEMVRQNRLLQARNDPFASADHASPGADDGYAAALNRRDLPIEDWMALRRQDISGVPWAATGAVQPVAYRAAGQPDAAHGNSAAAAPPRGPLTGRPGVAATIAGALDRIVAAPNTSTTVQVDGFNRSVQRGPGADVHLQGKCKFRKASHS